MKRKRPRVIAVVETDRGTVYYDPRAMTAEQAVKYSAGLTVPLKAKPAP